MISPNQTTGTAEKVPLSEHATTTDTTNVSAPIPVARPVDPDGTLVAIRRGVQKSTHSSPITPVAAPRTKINRNPSTNTNNNVDCVPDLLTQVRSLVHKDGSKNIGDCIGNAASEFAARRASMVLQDEYVAIAEDVEDKDDSINMAPQLHRSENTDAATPCTAVPATEHGKILSSGDSSVAPRTEEVDESATVDHDETSDTTKTQDVIDDNTTDDTKTMNDRIVTDANVETVEKSPTSDSCAERVIPDDDENSTVETAAVTAEEEPFIAETDATDTEASTVSEAPINQVSVPDPEPPKQVNTRFTNILRELANTEHVYLRDLSDIIEGYQKKLVHDVEEEDLDMIFGNIDDLLEFHVELGAKIDEYVAECPEKIGEVFSQMGSKRFMVYEKYYLNHMKSLSFLFQRQEDSEFLGLLVECQTQLGHQLPLADYLLKPVQRLLKYPLLFGEMIKATGGVVEGYESLHEASKVLKDVADNINEIKRKLDVSKYVESLQKRLLNWEGPDLVTFGQLKDAGFFKVSDSSSKKSQRQVLLFELGILICKPRAGGFVSVKHYFKMDDLYLQTMLNEALCFRLTLAHNKKVYFTFYCKNQEDKQYWIAKIKKVIIDFHTQGKKPLPPPAATKPRIPKRKQRGTNASDRTSKIRDSGVDQSSPSVSRRKFDFLQRRTTGRKRYSTVDPVETKAPVSKRALEDKKLTHNPFAEAGGFEDVGTEKRISHEIDRRTKSVKTKTKNRNSMAVVIDEPENENKRTSTLSSMSESSNSEPIRASDAADTDREQDVADATELATEAQKVVLTTDKVSSEENATEDITTADLIKDQKTDVNTISGTAIVEEVPEACVVRCNFPDTSHTSVIVKAGDSMKRAFSSRLARRGLKVSECIIRVPGEESTKINWSDEAITALAGKTVINVTKIKGSQASLHDNSRLVLRVPSGNLVVTHGRHAGVLSTPDKVAAKKLDGMNTVTLSPKGNEPEAIVIGTEIVEETLVAAEDDDASSTTTVEPEISSEANVKQVASVSTPKLGNNAVTVTKSESKITSQAPPKIQENVQVKKSTTTRTSGNTTLYMGPSDGPKPKFPSRYGRGFSIKNGPRAAPVYPGKSKSKAPPAIHTTTALRVSSAHTAHKNTAGNDENVVESKIAQFEKCVPFTPPEETGAAAVDSNTLSAVEVNTTCEENNAPTEPVNTLARKLSHKSKQQPDEVDHASIRYRKKQPPAITKVTTTDAEGGRSPAPKRAKMDGIKPAVPKRPTSMYKANQPSPVPRRKAVMQSDSDQTNQGVTTKRQNNLIRQSSKNKSSSVKGKESARDQVEVAQVRLRRDANSKNVNMNVKRWVSTESKRNSQEDVKRRSNRSSQGSSKHVTSRDNILSPTKKRSSNGHDEPKSKSKPEPKSRQGIQTRSSRGGFQAIKKPSSSTTGRSRISTRTTIRPPATNSFGLSNPGGINRFSVKHKIAQFGGGSTPETTRKSKIRKQTGSEGLKSPRHTDV